MPPLTMITSAIAIAQAAGLTDWIKRRFDGNPKIDAATRIVEIAAGALSLPNDDTDDIIDAIVSSPDAAERVRLDILDRQQEVIELQYKDLASARRLYVKADDHSTADRLAKQIMVWNLPAIIGLVICNCLAVYYIDNATIAVAIGNVIGVSVAYLWQERSQVVGFFFGSSIGSKNKQNVIERDLA